MPYIDIDARVELDMMARAPKTVGEYNYWLTTEILRWLPEKPTYSDYNAIIGVLECCKLEMYRRAVAPYEDQKKFDNGDVYE